MWTRSAGCTTHFVCQPLMGKRGGLCSTYAHIRWRRWSHWSLDIRALETLHSHRRVCPNVCQTVTVLCQMVTVASNQRHLNGLLAHTRKFPLRTSGKLICRRSGPNLPTHPIVLARDTLSIHRSQAGKCHRIPLCLRLVQIDSPILFIKRISTQSTL